MVERCDLSDCRGPSEPYITESPAIEIPEQGHRQAFRVTHTFIPPTSSRWPGHSCGLEDGQGYEIGLGDTLDKVRWWEWGHIGEVFSFPFRQRSHGPGYGVREVQMVLMNQVRFSVAE